MPIIRPKKTVKGKGPEKQKKELEKKSPTIKKFVKGKVVNEQKVVEKEKKGQGRRNLTEEENQDVFESLKKMVVYDEKKAKLFWTTKPDPRDFAKESAYKTWMTKCAGKEITTRANGQLVIRMGPRVVSGGRAVWMLVNDRPVPVGRSVLTKWEKDGLKASNFYLSD